MQILHEVFKIYYTHDDSTLRTVYNRLTRSVCTPFNRERAENVSHGSLVNVHHFSCYNKRSIYTLAKLRTSLVVLKINVRKQHQTIGENFIEAMI